MGLYEDENVVAATMRKRAVKKSRKYLVFGAIAATFLIPAGAWAFITISGHGSGEAAAFQPTDLQVSGVSFTPLFPGSTTDAHLHVKNTNPFPVKLQSVSSSALNTLNGSGCGTDGANLSGIVATNGSKNLSGDNAPTLPANGGEADITVPAVAGLSSAATGPCGFKVTLNVTGIQQSVAAAPAASGV